jgi:hypothetical protein
MWRQFSWECDKMWYAEQAVRITEGLKDCG